MGALAAIMAWARVSPPWLVMARAAARSSGTEAPVARFIIRALSSARSHMETGPALSIRARRRLRIMRWGRPSTLVETRMSSGPALT
ncbi:hypothetical protein D3C72_846890 [compost metagenome]